MKEVTFSVLLLFCYTSLIRSHSTTWTYHNIEYGVFANIYFVNNSWIGFAKMNSSEFHWKNYIRKKLTREEYKVKLIALLTFKL